MRNKAAVSTRVRMYIVKVSGCSQVCSYRQDCGMDPLYQRGAEKPERGMQNQNISPDSTSLRGSVCVCAGREKLQRSVLHVREGNTSEPISGMAFIGAPTALRCNNSLDWANRAWQTYHANLDVEQIGAFGGRLIAAVCHRREQQFVSLCCHPVTDSGVQRCHS